ncbi:MAG: HD domain-containing protein [Clostridia bacterium]|nr:HD domain-containing protein [Clostridia bacterium]
MNNKLIFEMAKYYEEQPERIQHYIKVFTYAKILGEEEKLSPETQHILETAAIVHDIGIKASEAKYGDLLGKHQEELGPAIAEDMLAKLGYDKKVIERVSYLVAHHHTYNAIDGLDYQILVEADFLVNIHENYNPYSSAAEAYKKIFKTEAGKRLYKIMYGIKE